VIEALAQWAAEGKLICHVYRAYLLAEMLQALKALTKRTAMGKVIVS
jgi:NADPH:quinone reductase-like Zn-dependent oxidoreductase